jgi:hypothetical protein
MILDAPLLDAVLDAPPHDPMHSLREAWQAVDPDVLTTLSDEITSLSARCPARTR